MKGPANLTDCGVFDEPFGQLVPRYVMPPKSRLPFWNRLFPQKFTGETALVTVVPSVTDRVPCGMLKPSANSHNWPLAKLLLGQAIGPVVPSVVAPLQTPVIGL